MSRAKTTKPKQDVAVFLEGLPPVPADFRVPDFDDPGGVWSRGLGQVRLDHADDSGPRKAFAAVKPLAWAVHVVGGVDNPKLRDDLQAVTSRHDILATRVSYIRRAKLPVPEELERELYEAEKELAAATSTWNQARARLNELNDLLRIETEKALLALAGALGHCADRLAGECARLVAANDPEFLLSFPTRAPDELVGLHARAMKISEIMNELGARHDVGMMRFWQACGEVAEVVVSGKLGLAQLIPTADMYGIEARVR